MDPVAKIMGRLEALGRISEEPDRLTRTFASPAMARANDLVKTWMVEAGLTPRLDAIGNLIGHRAGPEADSKILLIGSHLDTVRNAGKYDGPLGVVIAIACLEQIKETLPFAVEIIAFADEEGARYQTAYLGSRALTGHLTERDLALVDANGIKMSDALRQFGGDPARLKSCRMDPNKLLGYAEVHIEQGPVLEEEDQAVAVVTAIAGQSRVRVTFDGKPGHAGTTPMELRRDALCAAAQMITEAEKYAIQHTGMVATVGQISLDPNISNVIPGSCQMTLDLRHQHDAIRLGGCEALKKFGGEIAQLRRLKFAWETMQETPSVPCSADLSDRLRSAARRHQKMVQNLPSGAGHDAAVMARICPVAMLFVRCKDGLSHHPGESVRADDVGVALNVLTDFVKWT